MHRDCLAAHPDRGLILDIFKQAALAHARGKRIYKRSQNTLLYESSMFGFAYLYFPKLIAI